MDRHSDGHVGVVVPSFDVSGEGLEGVDVSCADSGVNGIGLTEGAELRLRIWVNLMEPTQTGIRPSFYEPLDQFPMEQEEPECSDSLVMLGVPLRMDGPSFRIKVLQSPALSVTSLSSLAIKSVAIFISFY